MDKASMRPKPIPPPKPALRLLGHNAPESNEEESTKVKRPVSRKVQGSSLELLSSTDNHIYKELRENNNNEGFPLMLNNKTDGGPSGCEVLLSPKPALLPKPQTPAIKFVSPQPKISDLRPPVPRRPESCLPDNPDPIKKESPKAKPLALWTGGGLGSRRNAKFPILALKAPVAKPEEFDGWVSSPSPIRPPRSPKIKLFLEEPFEQSDERPELPVKKRLMSSGSDGKHWEAAKKRSSSLGRTGNTNLLPDNGKSGSLGRNLSLTIASKTSSQGPIPPPRRRNKSESKDFHIDDKSNVPVYAQVNYEMKKNRRSRPNQNLPQTTQETQTVSQNSGDQEKLVIEGLSLLTGNLVLQSDCITSIELPLLSVSVEEAMASKEQPQKIIKANFNHCSAFDGDKANYSALLDSQSSGNKHMPVFADEEELPGNVIMDITPSIKGGDSRESLNPNAFTSEQFRPIEVKTNLPENCLVGGNEEANETITPIPSQLHRIASQQNVHDKVKEETNLSTIGGTEVPMKVDGNLSQLYRYVEAGKSTLPSPSQSSELHCNDAVWEQGVESTSHTDPNEYMTVIKNDSCIESERPALTCVFPDTFGLVIAKGPSLPMASQAGTRLWRRQSWSSSKDTTPSPERVLSASVRKPKHHRQAPWCDEGELSNGALADSDTSGSDNTAKRSLDDINPVRSKLTVWFDSFGKGGKKRTKDRKQRTSSFFGEDESKVHVSRPAPPVPLGPTREEANMAPKTDGTFPDRSFKDSESDNEEEIRNALGHRMEPEDQRKEKKVFFIAQELMTSEKEFVGVLKLLNVQFLEAVNAATGAEQNPVIPKTEFSKIINTLPQLQKLNEDLLRDLENRIENWSSFPKIADVIVKKGPFLKLYSSYIQNFESQCNYLDDCCQKYTKFARVVKEFEASPCCRKLNIKHFMLKPVQRIPQYRLLLEDYLRHLDVDSLDFRDTEEALRIIRDVADHANNSVKMGDHPSKLIELQSQLSNYEIIKPGRQFVKDGELFKLSRKGRHPRYFILLNDCLLYTCKSNTALIRVNNELPLNGMQVSLSKAEGYQSEFSIISITRSFTLSASSTEECQEWIDALQNAIKDHTERQLSFQKNVVHQVSVQPFILGKQAPVWIPDSRVTMCQSCTTTFTVMFRRHHCRACGKVVCSVCSDNRAPLRYLGFQAARVCEECHDTLLQEFDDPKTNIVQIMTDETNSKDVKEVSDTMRNLFKKSGAGGKKKIMLLKKEIPQRLKEVAANDSGSQVSGWLQRRGRRSWKRLWFVLKEQVLYVYKASEDVVALESIPVLGYKVEPMTERHFQIYEGIDARLVFQLAHMGQLPLVFHAESEQTASRWMQAMQEATVLK